MVDGGGSWLKGVAAGQGWGAMVEGGGSRLTVAAG